MRVLVTGAAGFIGYHTAVHLRDLGYDVVGADILNDFNGHGIYLYRRQQLLHEGIPIKHVDIRQAGSVANLFNERFDVVVHLAAKPGVRYSAQFPIDTYTTNVIGTQHVFDACARNGVRRVLYASSSSVYGNTTHEFMHECAELGTPRSHYAASKRTNEQQARILYASSGLPATGLRFFTVYGNMGRPDMAVWGFADAIMNDRELYLYGENTQRDFTHVSDVATSIGLLIQNGFTPELVNICRGHPVVVDDVVRLLSEHLGKPAKVVRTPLPTTDPALTHGQNGYLASMIGYQPVKTIEDGLKEFADWFRGFS